MMFVVNYVLFPTSISDKTSVSIESGGGSLVFLNISQDNHGIKLDYDEIKALKEILNGINDE